MSTLKRKLARLSGRVDDQVDHLYTRVKHRLGIGYGPLQILPYRSFGLEDRLTVMGRVLAQTHDFTADEGDRWWDNLADMYRRFASREVVGAPLVVRYGEAEVRTTSDAEGYFRIQIPLPTPVLRPGWTLADVQLEDAPAFNQVKPVTAQAEVLVPPSNADFGVISDIDDTIVLTHATSFLKMARMVFLNNARSRLPFAGVAAFYQALARGPQLTQNNPFFYVSSSAWNTYDLLVDFMALNEIPSGPLLLADYGMDETSFPFASHDDHKLAQIRNILDTYTDLRFILIGDSGQRDRAIYTQINEEYPKRILAIYIRDVLWLTRDAGDTAAAITRLSNGVEMILTPNTRAAAQHAAAQHFIASADIDRIHTDAAFDAGEPGAEEKLAEEPPLDQPPAAT